MPIKTNLRDSSEPEQEMGFSDVRGRWEMDQRSSDGTGITNAERTHSLGLTIK